MSSSPTPARARQHWQQGKAHADAGRWAQAAHAFAEASRIAPQDAVYALNLANAHLKQGEWAECAAVAGQVFRTDPSNGLACTLWSHSLSAMGRHADIVAGLRRLDPTRRRGVELHEALGRALQAQGDARGAIAAYMDALALQVQRADLHLQLGVCFNDLGRKAEAAQCYETALALDLGRQSLRARTLLAYADQECGHWARAAASMQAARAELAALPAGAAWPTTPFVHVVLGDDPLEQRRAAEAAARELARTLRPLPPAMPRTPDARAGRLRLGYLSADFHTHATALLLAGLLEQHDRRRVEVTLYSHGPDDGSAMRARLVAGSEHFVDLRSLSDAAAAARIRADDIDVLVELKGWTQQHRLGICLHRPARVQASWLGYPGTTGCEAIDYLVGDPVVTPLAHAAHYTEQLAQLPGCYQPNDRARPRPTPPARAALGLPDEAVVLCGFNQPFKLSAAVLDVWCRVLQQAPRAVLWLLEWNGEVRAAVEREALARGIERTRLHWAPRREPAEHLARLQQADLFLDAWPCNGHTTASDALWAGVPVLTFPGRSFASRVAASLDHAAGLSEAVCADLGEYEARAVALATDDAARAALRQALAERRAQAALFDTAAQVRAVEALVARMLARHDDGLPPAPLAAESLAS